MIGFGFGLSSANLLLRSRKSLRTTDETSENLYPHPWNGKFEDSLTGANDEQYFLKQLLVYLDQNLH